MTSLPEIVALMYRADWTKLSLSADVQGEHVLIAPGRRCRSEHGSCVNSRDGDRTWMLDRELPGEMMTWGGLDPPFPEHFDPAGQLSAFALTYPGDEVTQDRRTHHLIAIPRPDRMSRQYEARRVDLFVDAEFGIVLRREDSYANRAGWSTELSNLRVDPPEANDPSQFAAPPGVKEHVSPLQDFPSIGAAKFAANAASAGLGMFVRYVPDVPWRRPAARHDAEAAMPPAEPEPPPGEQLTDDQLYLLHLGGTREPVLSATAHLWTDPALFGGVLKSGADKAGMGGLRILGDAIERRSAANHTITAIQLGTGGRYRIERPGADERKYGRRKPNLVVCDGKQRWQVFGDRALASAPKSFRDDLGQLAELIDPSWLPRHWLSDQADVVSGDRPAIRFRVLRRDGRDRKRPGHFHRADVTVDMELGVITRLVLYRDDKPVQRAELRDLAAVDSVSPDLPPGLRVERERLSASDFFASRLIPRGNWCGDGGG